MLLAWKKVHVETPLDKIESNFEVSFQILRQPCGTHWILKSDSTIATHDFAEEGVVWIISVIFTKVVGDPRKHMKAQAVVSFSLFAKSHSSVLWIFHRPLVTSSDDDIMPQFLGDLVHLCSLKSGKKFFGDVFEYILFLIIVGQQAREPGPSVWRDHFLHSGNDCSFINSS